MEILQDEHIHLAAIVYQQGIHDCVKILYASSIEKISFIIYCFSLLKNSNYYS